MTATLPAPDRHSRTRRILSGTVAGVVQQIVTIAMQFALVPLIIKQAGPETNGAYTILTQLIGWGAITNLGLGVTAWRFMAEAHGLDDGGVRFATIMRTTRFMYWITNAAFAAFVLVAGVAATLLVSLEPDLAARLRMAATLYSAWAFLRTPLALYADALYATQNVALASMTSTLGSVLRLAGSILFVWSGFGLIGLTVAAVLAEFVAGVTGYALFARLHPEIDASAATRDANLMNRMLAFGSTFLISIVSNQLATNTSGLVIGSLYNARAVSVLYTSQMPAMVLGQTIRKLSDSAGPAVTQMYAASQQEGLRCAYLTLLRVILACGLSLAVGLVAFSRAAITLWVGTEQYAGDLFTTAIAATTVVEIILHLQLVFFIAHGEVRGLGIVTLIASLLRIAIWLAVGKTVGLGGMMLVATGTQLAVMAYSTARVHRMLGLPHRQSLLISWLRPLTIAAGCTAFIIAATTRFPLPNDWISLVIWSAAFTAVWSVLCWLVGCTRSERALALAACRRQYHQWWGHPRAA